MNAELMEALQNCANVNYEYRAEGASCSKCPYKEASYCKRKMMRAAADALEAAEQRIAKLEAQLPKEGKWIEQELAPKNYRFCKQCGFANKRKSKWNYCPNCGAKMDGKDGEHE